MPAFVKLRNILSGRSRKWGNTNNQALHLFADQIPRVLSGFPDMVTLFTRSVTASHMTVEGLVFRNAPKASLPIPFASLTAERMHAVHTRGLEMFATMYAELHKLPTGFVFADMLRHVCTPTPPSFPWQEKVSEICHAEKFNLFPIAKGFVEEIAGIYPEARTDVSTMVSASALVGSTYVAVVRDCLTPQSKA